MTTRARREREKEKRRQSILRAAREVFLNSGLHRATVDNVAEQAEVSKGTVYLYFESKETILAHLLLEGLDELIEELEQAYAADESIGADERLRQLGWAYLRFFEREPEYFRLLMAMDRGRFQDSVTPGVYQEVLSASLEGLDWVIKAIRQGIDEEAFPCCDVRLAASTLWAMLNGVLELMNHPLRREMVGTEREALYQTAIETVIQGLQAPPNNRGGD
ncbi:MAG: TetR/AcrR family transcriptional regulator [Chloroflexota bacterium]|nr:TetR/AcrR family transcriptional regulator [Chloroflexota bacterium]